MNITRKCDDVVAPGNCWHMNIEGVVKQYNGANDPSYATLYPGIALTNGSLLMFRFSYPNCNGLYSGLISSVSCALIRVDVNGFKPPNTFGKDIFDFHVLQNVVSPRGGTYDSAHDCSSSGGYCAGAFLSNG